MFRPTVAVVAAFLFTLSACGNDNAGSGAGTTTTSGSGGGEAVAWAERVCKSVESDIEALSRTPDIKSSDSPQQIKTALSTFLDDFATTLDRMIGGIKGAGAPPVADGQQIMDEASKDLDEAQNLLKEAKSKIDSAPVNDLAAFQAAFTQAGQDLKQIAKLDPTDAFEKNPELKKAFDNAETCKKLDKSSDSSSSSAPTS